MPALGRVLIIAGSDSGGGAGIQADIKAVTALGGYAATAVTALTAQNTLGVHGVFGTPPAFVRQQIEVVLNDIGADAIKTGMLAEPAIVETVAEALEAWAHTPLVVDPVMVAKGGAALLSEPAVEAVRTLLLPKAAVVTPNAPEAARLVGFPVEDLEQQKRAAAALLELGAAAALVKGGHLQGERLFDVLASRSEGVQAFEGERLAVRATHGTGCTLASALACGLAQGLSLAEATQRARAYVREAMRLAPGFGAGHAPLDHGWPLRNAGLRTDFASPSNSPMAAAGRDSDDQG